MQGNSHWLILWLLWVDCSAVMVRVNVDILERGGGGGESLCVQMHFLRIFPGKQNETSICEVILISDCGNGQLISKADLKVFI